MEMTMDDKQPYASAIAAEAGGERLADPTSRTARENAENRPQEPDATSAGPQAGIAEKTAEAVGERVGDAYADATTTEARERSREIVQRAATQLGSRARSAANDMATAGDQAAQFLSHQFDQQRSVKVLVAFGLGYLAALLLHGRGQ
jgi:hypothetical protein